MSIEAANWAWKQAIKPNAKLVLLALADRANADGVSWPSIRRMAKETGLNERSIYRHIKDLSDLSLIVVRSDNGRGNSYQLNLLNADVPLTTCHPCQTVTPDKLSPLTECQETPDKLSPVPLTKTTNVSDIEPKEEPKENPKKNTRAKKPKPDKLVFGQFGNVRMTKDEYDKLISEQGEARALKAIAKLDTFIGSKGDKYKSHYMTMFSWVLKAVDEDEDKSRWQPPGLARDGPVATTQHQADRQNQINMAKFVLAAQELEKNGNIAANSNGASQNGNALPPANERGRVECFGSELGRYMPGDERC